MLKRMISLLLVATLLVPMFALSTPEAAAATTYDPYKAIAFAENNWTRWQDQPLTGCADFAYNCLLAGGMPISPYGLRESIYVTTGVAEAACRAIGKPYTGVKDFPRISITYFYGPTSVIKEDPQNAALSIGDLIFTFCDTCGRTPHVEIWDGRHTSYDQGGPSIHLGGVGPGHEGHSLSLRYLDLSDAPLKDCACQNYIDVSPYDWFHDDVEKILQSGLMNGVSWSAFKPEGAMTRAMLVTVLWRYNLEQEATAASFTDVKDTEWYAAAVAWAAQEGIVGGVGNDRFAPNSNVTREQLATILHRYTEYMGNDTSARAELSSFPDGSKVSVWALDAMQWAVAVGLIGGSNGKLLPQGNATRAQVAAILNRYIRQYGIVPTEGTLGETHSWTLSADGTLTISGTGDIPAPSYYDREEFEWHAEPWNNQKAYIRRLVIADGATSVPGFSDYDSLEEVILPDSVTKIGTFGYCDRLHSLTIPPKVTEISLSIIEQCGEMDALFIPANVQKINTDEHYEALPCPIIVDENNANYCSDTAGVLFNKDKTELITAHNDLSGTYTVPESVEVIHDYAFMFCDRLNAITLPEKMQRIGERAFAYCTKLSKIRMPSSISSFGPSTFERCVLLKSVKIPEGCTSTSSMFLFCVSLQEVKLPDSFTELSFGTFYTCRSLKTLVIPKNVTVVGEAFIECDNLTDLYFMGNAPTLKYYEPNGWYTVIPKGVTIHYIAGTTGWNDPVWSNYTLKPWTP